MIVAVNQQEVEGLKILYQRGKENKVDGLQLLDGKQLLEIEPYCTGGIAALYSPNTGIVNFKEMAQSFTKNFQNLGGDIFLNFEVTNLQQSLFGIHFLPSFILSFFFLSNLNKSPLLDNIPLIQITSDDGKVKFDSMINFIVLQ